MRFIVEWTDHEGNLQQRAFDSREDAQLEAASLEKEFDYIGQAEHLFPGNAALEAEVKGICGCKNDNLPCDAKISPHIFAGSRFCPNCGAKMDVEVKAT